MIDRKKIEVFAYFVLVSSLFFIFALFSLTGCRSASVTTQTSEVQTSETSSISDTTTSQVQESSPTNESAENEQLVRTVVDEFGKSLVEVSLTAPPDILEEQMRESYSDFLSESLIDKWLQDPSQALGKVTSSPWPDRIDILEVEKVNEAKYIVYGEVIEMTSVEAVQGGFSGKYPVTLTLELIENRWIITMAEAVKDLAAGWKIYTNEEYAFEIMYPENLNIETEFQSNVDYFHLGNQWRVGASEDTSGKLIMSIVIYRIENTDTYPRYFNTELRIGASSDPDDLANCTSPGNGETAAVPPTEEINGITFNKFIFQDAAMMQYIEGTNYRTEYNDMCFAVEQLKSGSNYRDNPSPEDIPDSVLESYYNKIYEIIKTFRFTDQQ